MTLQSLMAKTDAGEETKWLETALLTILAVGTGFVLHPQDPFFVTSAFPWIWFAPVLIALRYGMAPALLSVLLLTLMMLTRSGFGPRAEPFPVRFLLGGLVLTMVCGQFSSVWRQRLRKAGLLAQQARERAEQLSREYFMVRLSHDRLEQNLISRPITLRDGIARLRQLLAEHGGEMNREVSAGLLTILAHYCRIDSASLYLLENGRLGSEPVYSCGRGAPLDPADPLLRSALEAEDVLCHSVGSLRAGRQSRYLVAAPMRHSSGELIGLLLVSEMPFLALNNEFLQILGLLLSYCADHALAAKTAADILDHYPDCPPVFASDLKVLHQLRKTQGITSSLVLLQLPASARTEEFAELFAQQVRGLDHLWRRPGAKGMQLVTLMPFAGDDGFDGFMQRIGESVQRKFGASWQEAGIISRFRQLVPTVPALTLLNDLLEGTDA